MNIYRGIAEIDELLLVHGNDHALLRRFFHGVSFRDVEFDAGLEDRRGDHKNDEQDQHHVHEGDHVDLGERRLGTFLDGCHRQSVESSPGWAAN